MPYCTNCGNYADAPARVKEKLCKQCLKLPADRRSIAYAPITGKKIRTHWLGGRIDAPVKEP